VKTAKESKTIRANKRKGKLRETPTPASAGKSLSQARLNHCQGVACWGVNAAKE
jgi:hypothetical protein